jgi:hypothetical protein
LILLGKGKALHIFPIYENFVTFSCATKVIG